MQRRAARVSLAAALIVCCLPLSGWTDSLPALVALLLDTSGSLAPRDLDRTRRLALEVMGGLPPGSEVVVFTFDDQSRLVLPRTSRADEVARALAAVRISGQHTALYDALYDASRYLRDAGAARSAIVLLTDGRDEDSALNLDDGLQLAEQGRIRVFTVGVGRVEERVLRRIAKLTGGQYAASRDATGTAVASAIMAAAAEPGPARAARSPGPVGATGSGAIPAVFARVAEPAAAPRRWAPRLGIAAALAVVGGAAVVLAVRRRTRRAAEDRAAALAAASRQEREDTMSGMATVVSRLGATTEEYLEKTVVLRDRAVLAVTRGPLAGQLFELSPHSATSLGRSKANDLVLDDASVSSQHCRIRPDGAGFTLLDLKSTNGTFVNERRVTTHKLAEGDVIRLGEIQLQFRMEQRRD
jgi:hypothetical protein